MARPHIVIVGAGFGGLSAAHALAGAEADVTVVDRRNYHLFQPLLYQVATAGLSPAQIAAPIRAILRRAANVQVLLGRVTGVDKAARTVMLEDRTLSYDWLVLATGARHAYFGHDEWRRWRRVSRRSTTPPRSAAASSPPSSRPRPAAMPRRAGGC